ncbi:MAG TPA: hypothetical protein VGQ46_12390 [Thermoanaerobaculia bacterium]|nr:hypothetical protein [Thermoanaerobaculia bacterium]
MLTFDYFRQESIRKFLADSRRTGRPKAIVIDGCIMLYDLLVIGLATRIGSTPDKVRKKHGRLKPLAREALTDEYIPLRDVIFAIADARNAAAHETITDADFEAKFVSVWSMVSGGAAWPESVVVRSSYCRAFFSLLAFDLGRWQVSLSPSGYFSGVQVVDWDRFSR